MGQAISLSQLGLPSLSQGYFEDLLAGRQELIDGFMTGARAPRMAAGAPGGNVLGVGITRHVVNGKKTDMPALLLLIDRVPRDESRLPQMSSRGVPVQHEAVGQIRPLTIFQQAQRPVPGGVSVGPSNIAGTTGCVVMCGINQYVLSCAHVLAGNTWALPQGTAICQQSTVDGGNIDTDQVASLSYTTVLNVGGTSTADAAMAQWTTGIAFDAGILRADGTVEALAWPNVAPVQDMPVQKSGRTTGYTTGDVHALGLTISMAYSGQVTSFDNVFSVSPASSVATFAAPGDSGSLITTLAANQPVGLVFGGDTANNRAYGAPIADVLTALGAITGQEVDIVI